MNTKIVVAVIVLLVLALSIGCSAEKPAPIPSPSPSVAPKPVATPTPPPIVVGDSATGCIDNECPRTQDAKYWYLLGQVRGGEKVTAPELERRIREQVEAVGGAKAATAIAEAKAQIAERDREEAKQKLAILENELAARRRQPGRSTGCERLSGHAHEICERL